MTKFTIFCFCISAGLTSLGCSDDFTDIVPSTAVLEEEIFTDIQRAREFINPAYGDVASSPSFALEGYTNNLTTISSNRGATAGYSAENAPTNGQWGIAYRQIFHINEFLQKSFKVPFDAFDIETSDALKKRIRGEAFGLRAYYKWILLKNFSGPSAQSGEMLGFPIVDELISIEDANNIPRNTFEECYASIFSDIEQAYNNIGILRYSGTDQNPISGVQLTSRLSREALLALKARVALFAASPAYKKISWAAAADISYNAIVEIEQGTSLIDLQAFGDFNRTDNSDHFWRVGYSNNGGLELINYPPSMFGRGVFNPTQNIVDVFPDANGFPITDLNTTYQSGKSLYRA
ncbi:RagB/SusD family nutrient uptake outer membrane protein [Zobellia nedashkovskayae]